MADLLTSEPVCDLAEMPVSTLAGWVKQGIVSPTKPGTVGRCAGHRFSRMQTLGIMVGAALRRSERGCVLSYVREVVSAFSQFTEDELLARFAAGRTHFNDYIGDSGRPMLDIPQLGNWVDVKLLYGRLNNGALQIKLVESRSTSQPA